MAEGGLAMAEERGKRPFWTRVLDVGLRTVHVAVTAVFLGGAMFNVPFDELVRWHQLAVATGVGLIASEVYHCYHWPYQGRGLMGLLHAGLFGCIYLRPDLRASLGAAALVVGMVGSHMPKKLRYWSFVHGRVVTG